MTETWRIRVTDKERESVERRATREGWKGYSGWLRERLLWACREGKTADEREAKAARTAFLTARFTPDDLDGLRRFAAQNKIDLSSWARSVALAPNTQLQDL